MLSNETSTCLKWQVDVSLFKKYNCSVYDGGVLATNIHRMCAVVAAVSTLDSISKKKLLSVPYGDFPERQF